VIFFLEKYKNFGQKDREFFEGCFAYAILDFIDDQKYTRCKYNLEAIAKEAFLIDSKERIITKDTLKQILEDYDAKFMNLIKSYFIVFYKSGRKTD